MVLQLETEKIVWPGNLRKKPSGLMIPTHLQVMTINEKPFVYSRQIKPIEKCLEEPCDSCDLKNGEIPCPIYNTTHQDQNGKEEYCCYGYCIDLLVELAKQCNFTYNLHLSKNDYGALTRNNKTEKQEWSGLIGELVAQKEESLNLTSAVWFAWGVLLNAGIGEGTPRSFSARVLGMVWAGFAMIIVASYTANLAAFLVLDKPQTSLTGINDPRLRNPMENFTYATVKASAVDMYFRRQVELSNMYRTMEGKHYETPDEAIKAVKDGKLKAFIWDSSRLEYEAARSCHLITAGDLFGRSGYGVGLQKGSPWADKITLAILDYHESGRMEELDNKWILSGKTNQDCKDKDGNNPVTLGLENMRGVFILVGLGIVGGVGLIVVEILYHKHKVRRERRAEAAKDAINRWKGTIEPLACLYRKARGRRKSEENTRTNNLFPSR